MAAQRELMAPPQLSLLDLGRLTEGEPFLIGRPAYTVFREILNRQPVKQVSFVVYDHSRDSEEAFDTQLLQWVEAEEAAHLFSRDRLVTLSALTQKDILEDSPFIPAVGSLAGVGNEALHIPQIDFFGKTNDLAFLRERVSFLLGPGRWAIVDTGKSYHAWGIHTLMTGEEWRQFVEGVRERSQSLSDNPRADSLFIKKSLERGFSALRLHSKFIDEPPPIVVDVFSVSEE